MIDSLISLIETGHKTFYSHFTNPFNNRGEVQWIDGSWRFRWVAYEGEWIYVNSPTNIDIISEKELNDMFQEFLLTEYSYYAIIEPNEFREKQIEKVLGLDICLLGVEATQEFMEALRESIERVLK